MGSTPQATGNFSVGTDLDARPVAVAGPAGGLAPSTKDGQHDSLVREDNEAVLVLKPAASFLQGRKEVCGLLRGVQDRSETFERKLPNGGGDLQQLLWFTPGVRVPHT